MANGAGSQFAASASIFCAGTTGTPTLNKHVRRASVSVVPEGTIDESAVLRESGSFTDGTQLLAEALGKKLPYPAPSIRMAPDTVFDFLVALLSLVFGDFPAGRFAELRRCLFLGQDDAPAKRGLDQLGELAVKPFGLQRLEFFAAIHIECMDCLRLCRGSQQGSPILYQYPVVFDNLKKSGSRSVYGFKVPINPSP